MAERDLWYPACPGPDCKKKVTEEDKGWFCEKCAKVYPNCKPTYNFSVRMGDMTRSIYA